MITAGRIRANKVRAGALIATHNGEPYTGTNPQVWIRVVHVDRGMFVRLTLANKRVVRVMPNKVVIVAQTAADDRSQDREATASRQTTTAQGAEQ